MKKTNPTSIFIIFSLIFSITLFSCRKKDERYEGEYVGIERYTFTDSGATTPTIDSTYLQQIDIAYEKRKYYTFERIYNATGNGPVTHDKNSIVDHKCDCFGDIYTDQLGNEIGGIDGFEFNGDSLYYVSEGYWNGEQTKYEFFGKR